MSHRPVACLALLVASAVAAPGFAADDKAQNAVRIGVPYAARTVPCTVTVGVADIALAYYSGTNADLQAELDTVFACAALGAALKPQANQTAAEDSVVMFLARPTAAASETSLIHVLYRRKQSRFASTTLPGVRSLNWIYITETPGETIVSQVTAAPVSNPILGQLGNVLSAIEKPFEKLQNVSVDHELQLSVAANVSLTFRRSTIVETDFVSTTVRNEQGKDVPKQITGSLTMTNTPHTWVTANAVAGATVGDATGAQRMKVDNKAYASDPLPIGLTGAGLTLHVPFDPLSPGPTWREVFGLYVGGVLTPGAGFSIGGSIGWRGIAFVFGSAWIRVQTAPDNLDAGSAVPPGVSPQLVYGASTSAFVGGSYAFK